MMFKPLKPKISLIFLYIVALAGIILFMNFLTTCNDNKLPPLAEGNSNNDTIDIAILYSPLSYYIYSDTIGGINYDLIKRFEKETGTPVKLWPVVDINKAYNKIQDGTFRLLASIPSDYNLKKRFLTTESVYLDKLTLIQLKDSVTGNIKIKSTLDLNDDTIAIIKNSPAKTRIENLSEEIGKIIPIKEYSDYSDEYLCMEVANERIPFAVVNEKVAENMKKKSYSHLSFDTPIGFTQFQVWVANKKDTLLISKINNWLLDFQKRPEYKTLINKY